MAPRTRSANRLDDEALEQQLKGGGRKAPRLEDDLIEVWKDQVAYLERVIGLLNLSDGEAEAMKTFVKNPRVFELRITLNAMGSNYEKWLGALLNNTIAFIFGMSKGFFLDDDAKWTNFSPSTSSALGSLIISSCQLRDALMVIGYGNLEGREIFKGIETRFLPLTRSRLLDLAKELLWVFDGVRRPRGNTLTLFHSAIGSLAGFNLSLSQS